ncbi:MAG TPA: Qat anti-phage system associated protein QatB, partial [Candidatus Elarobacter sp.]|nr:Qat anti-phage system associated protein QatB [Candidatus Elarobacter sp.]
MGTSSGFKGPIGRRPLLPPWPYLPHDPAPEQDNGKPATSPDGGGPVTPPEAGPTLPLGHPGAPRPPIPAPVPTATWAKAKLSFSQFVGVGGSGGRGGRTYLRRAGRRFVRAQGGSLAAAQAARAGRRTAQRLGGFLGTAVTAGVAEAVRRLGIESYVGRDVWSFLSDLVDALAPAGATIEEDTARRALTETLRELYGGETELLAVGRLEALTPAAIGVALERYVARYVYTQLLAILGSRLYDSSRDETAIRRLEQDVQDYIYQTVR